MTQLNCPMCGSKATRVIDVRITGSGLRRRRLCEKCERRFSTLETVVIDEVQALAQEIEQRSGELEDLLNAVKKTQALIVQLKLKQAEYSSNGNGAGTATHGPQAKPEPKPQKIVTGKQQASMEKLRAAIALKRAKAGTIPDSEDDLDASEIESFNDFDL